jgi:hypothetical protein
MRKCPFNGCNQRVPLHRFGCRSHWFSLSKPERNEIWAAYNDYNEGKIDIDTLRRRQQTVLGTRGVA